MLCERIEWFGRQEGAFAKGGGEEEVNRGHQYLVSEEMEGDGRRRYALFPGVGSVVTYHESNKDNALYAMVLRDRPIDLFADVDNMGYDSVLALLEQLEQTWPSGSRPVCLVFESSTSTKQSYHVHAWDPDPHTAFFSLAHLGRYMYTVICTLRNERPDLVMYEKDGSLKCCMDETVYTKNRNFRMPGSSKRSAPQRKFRILRPIGRTDAYGRMFAGEEFCADMHAVFSRALIIRDPADVQNRLTFTAEPPVCHVGNRLRIDRFDAYDDTQRRSVFNFDMFDGVFDK